MVGKLRPSLAATCMTCLRRIGAGTLSSLKVVAPNFLIERGSLGLQNDSSAREKYIEIKGFDNLEVFLQSLPQKTCFLSELMNKIFAITIFYLLLVLGLLR